MFFLVGGWTNPSEKYARQNGLIFPNFQGEHKTYECNHHLVISFCLWQICKLTCSLNQGPETKNLLVKLRSATPRIFWTAECWHLGKTWQLCFLPMGVGLPSVGFRWISSRSPCHTSFHKLTQPHLITNINHLAKTQPKPPNKPTSQDAPSQHQVTFTAHIHPEFYGPALRTSDSAKRQSASKPVPGLGSAGNSENGLPAFSSGNGKAY